MHLINIVNCTLCTLLYFIVYLEHSTALRDVRVQIPHAVKRGEKATLNCLYDLEGDSLYSVKWYKGRREFYSFTPKETPAMKVFQFAGVKVDRTYSNESQLVLEAVNAATSGKYSCEVSADAPSFHTLIGAGELEVVVPGKDPVITGIRSRYKVGDIVRGNCTSSHSRPAANITWTVNGYETNPAHIRHFKPLKDPRELETVISAIHFVITPQHFIYGKLKIRCTAHIHDVYWKSTEKSIEENRLGKAGMVNVVQTFSEDYFDLEEGNVVDRSDTYMTHIKGDVSSLNASGSSALHKCSCFWPRLTTLSLILYALQQMYQLLQQLFGQQTTIATTGGVEGVESQVAATASLTTISAKQNMNNCRIIKRKININREKEKADGEGDEVKNKNLLTTMHEQHLSGILIATTATTAAAATSTLQVATICDKQIVCKERKQYTLLYWPQEKFYQIKLIKKKEKLKQRVEDKVQLLKKQQQQHLALDKQQQQQRQQQQQHCNKQKYLEYLQQECDKTLYEYYNLTMTTQVANIFKAATFANIAGAAAVVASIVRAGSPISYKPCFTNHNLSNAQYCKTPYCNHIPSMTSTTTSTSATSIVTNSTDRAATITTATCACNISILKDIFSTATATTSTIATTTT